jgi:endonuclease III
MHWGWRITGKGLEEEEELEYLDGVGRRTGAVS